MVNQLYLFIIRRLNEPMFSRSVVVICYRKVAIRRSTEGYFFSFNLIYASAAPLPKY